MGGVPSATVWLVCLLAAQPLAANVLTETLHWRAPSLAAGLLRLKDQFLDVSIHQDREYVGGVFRMPDGTFVFSQGRGAAGRDRITFRIRPIAEGQLIGFWHTHGADGPARAAFSGTDSELVRTSGLPFYLITPAGHLRVLRPEHVARRPGARLPGLPRGAHPGEYLRERTTCGAGDVMEV